MLKKISWAKKFSVKNTVAIIFSNYLGLDDKKGTVRCHIGYFLKTRVTGQK
jgi:hypothetical protein